MNPQNPLKLTLNPFAEVSLHGQAGCVEWTMERVGPCEWSMVVRSIDFPMLREFKLTDAQASATLALFIGELEQHPDLNAGLYDIAEQVWKDVPVNFRMIP